LRLRGQGLGGHDLFVETQIVTPATIDDESRKLVEEFAKRNPQKPRTGGPWE
jgi:DnaJ-class molecular chaperone